MLRNMVVPKSFCGNGEGKATLGTSHPSLSRNTLTDIRIHINFDYLLRVKRNAVLARHAYELRRLLPFPSSPPVGIPEEEEKPPSFHPYREGHGTRYPKANRCLR